MQSGSNGNSSSSSSSGGSTPGPGLPSYIPTIETDTDIEPTIDQTVTEEDIRNNRLDVFFGRDGRRSLDVFYTENNTKLFVRDGLLVEQLLRQEPPQEPPRPPSPVRYYNGVDVLTLYKETNRSVAEAAMEYYNSKNTTKYELVEPVCCNGNIWSRGLWYHSNFTAKPRDSQGHPKLFFSEMKIAGKKSRKSYVVTSCRPINGCKTARLCGICENDKLLHPIGRFRQGLEMSHQRDLRPRSNGKFLRR